MRTNNRIMSLILAIAFLLTGFIQAQSAAVGLPVFDAKVVETYSREADTTLARIYIQIVNDNLTFVKTEEVFKANIQVELFFSLKDSETVFNRTLKHEFTVDNFDLTNSRNVINTFHTDLPMSAGIYNSQITVLDENNSEQFSRKLSFEIQGFSESGNLLSVSDLLFFEEYNTDADGSINQINPKLSNSFSSDDQYVHVYFNTFTRIPQGELKIGYKVVDNTGEAVLQNTYASKIDQDGYSEHFLKLNRFNFSRNQYNLEVIVTNGEQSVMKTAPFEFFWKFLPNTEQDLDMAIRQLRYIGREDSIKHYLKKGSYEAKKAFFQRFWASKDPNPDTEANELMEEYYRRIQFSNARFANGSLGGWISDRGRIFIKFGEPDDVERHPFEPNGNPYEIWRYYSLQKNFLFIDRTGFGDYDLHPSYYYVEYE